MSRMLAIAAQDYGSLIDGVAAEFGAVLVPLFKAVGYVLAVLWAIQTIYKVLNVK